MKLALWSDVATKKFRAQLMAGPFKDEDEEKPAE